MSENEKNFLEETEFLKIFEEITKAREEYQKQVLDIF